MKYVRYTNESITPFMVRLYYVYVVDEEGHYCNSALSLDAKQRASSCTLQKIVVITEILYPKLLGCLIPAL